MSLDHDSPVSLYEQLAAVLRGQIERGELTGRVPSVKSLAQQYEVVGFPTIIAVNGDGQKLWQFEGYFPGGPDAFIEELQKLRKG